MSGPAHHPPHPEQQKTSAGDTMRKILMSCLLTALACVVLFGCTKPRIHEPDPFFEEWRLKAEESQGFSPSEEFQAIEVEEFIEELEPEVVREPDPPLPTMRVSLRLRDVPVAAVLQALSKAAKQNIVFSSAVKETVSINLDNVPWDQAFQGLLAVNGLVHTWEGRIIRVMTVAEMEHDLRIATALKERAEAERQIVRAAPLTARILRINYADAEALRDNLINLMTMDAEGKSQGSIVVNKHTNSLVVKANQGDQERIMNMVRHLDKPRAQILIRATIVEATKDTARDLGIQWGGRAKTTTFNVPWAIGPGVGGPAGAAAPPVFDFGRGGAGMGANFPANLAGSGLTLGLIIGGRDFLEMQLSALQQDGKLNILSSPSITTMDNQMAFTENGEKVPFVTTDAEGNREVNFEDAVLRLEITPNSIGSNLLKMKINVKKDEVDFTREVDGNPLIIKKQTETTLIAESGETIVISGLTKQRNQFSEQGVPGVKDVQGLGWLFKREDTGVSMEEVLIFITPTILPPRAMNLQPPPAVPGS